jgi:hypothetical protein
MKFPKVSGKVIAAVVIILIVLYFFRREGYEVDQGRLIAILNDPTIMNTLSDAEKNTIVTAINESPIPSLPAELKPILDTRPTVRDNLVKLLETSKPQPVRTPSMRGPMGRPMGPMGPVPVPVMGGQMGGMPRGFSCQFNN